MDKGLAKQKAVKGKIEKAILAYLIDRQDRELLQQLKEEYFSGENKEIFKAMSKLNMEDRPFDLVTIGSIYLKATYLTDVADYIYKITGTKTEAEMLIKKLKKEYIREVIAQKLKEEYIKIGDIDNPLLIKAEISEFLSKLEENDERKIKTAKEVFQETVEYIEKQYKLKTENAILKTHLQQLNNLISGLIGGEVVVIGGRPSVGKTAFALDLAMNIVKENKKIYFVTREMSAKAIYMRIISKVTSISTSKLRAGNIKDEDWGKIGRAIIENGEIFFDEYSEKISEIRIAAKELKAKNGLDIIFIDYLQLLTPDEKLNSREQEVAYISRNVKKLAKEMDVPIVVLAQLNREAEGKKPTNADLRESGAIEADADIILMLWVPPDNILDDEWKHRKKIITENHCKLVEGIVTKNRNGPTGQFYMMFSPINGQFQDLT